MRLTGRLVESVERHGKFLVFSLDDGHKMVAHLGMSGRFSVADDLEPTVRHTHFVARLDDDTQIRFVDPRTFGFVAVYDEDELGRSGLARLGPDAWDGPPDVSELRMALAARTAPIKALLLDQRALAGLGNIAISEIGWRACVHPHRSCASIRPVEWEALWSATREHLNYVLEVEDEEEIVYLSSAGAKNPFLCYGRAGEPCSRCETPFQRQNLSNRVTFYCPRCQESAP